MKIREVLRLLESDGWQIVTVAGHPGEELAPGTLNSVLKQAGLKK